MSENILKKIIDNKKIKINKLKKEISIDYLSEKINENKDIQFHRDGIGYLYIQDPDSNYIELIDRKS